MAQIPPHMYSQALVHTHAHMVTQRPMSTHTQSQMSETRSHTGTQAQNTHLQSQTDRSQHTLTRSRTQSTNKLLHALHQEAWRTQRNKRLHTQSHTQPHTQPHAHLPAACALTAQSYQTPMRVDWEFTFAHLHVCGQTQAVANTHTDSQITDVREQTRELNDTRSRSSQPH